MSVLNKERFSKFEAAIIEGKAYEAYGSDATLANNETLNIAFKTPDTAKRLHFYVLLSSRAMGYYDLIEGEAWDTNTGTQTTIYNKNRNSSNISTVLGDQTGTFTAGEIAVNVTGLDGNGTIIRERSYGGSVNAGNLNCLNELEMMILKQDETYVIKFTSLTNSNSVLITLLWYEE